MDALVVYETYFGNTRQIAQAIGVALGERYQVRMHAIGNIAPISPAIDLLVIGGPTHHHGTSQTMRTFLEGLGRGALRGVAAAAFDTRYPGARWLTGSAAIRIARSLRKVGAQLVAGPESFFVGRNVPPDGEQRRHEREYLLAGEVERAAVWARRIVEVSAVGGEFGAGVKTDYSSKPTHSIRPTPRPIATSWSSDFVAVSSLCSSGSRSDPAM
jgi:flavodoxin